MGTWIERLGWERLFPLTPALSPGERENRSQHLDKSGALESGTRCDESPMDKCPNSSPSVGTLDRSLGDQAQAYPL